MKKSLFLSVFIILLGVLLVLAGCSLIFDDTTSHGGGWGSYDVEMTYYLVASTATSFYLKPMQTTVHFKGDPTLEDKVKVALSLLASKTLNTDDGVVPLPEDTNVLGVKIDGDKKTAEVNFSEEILRNPGFGAEGEMLALCAIPLSAKQFGIESVYVLINGQKPSEENGYIDFWGHVGLYDQPLTASGCEDAVRK